MLEEIPLMPQEDVWGNEKGVKEGIVFNNILELNDGGKAP